MFSVKSLVAAAIFSFGALLCPLVSAQEWSLEKPKGLGWYEVVYKCIDFEKQDKKNYFITLYYGTNSKGEHKYMDLYTALVDVQNTSPEVKITTQRERIYSADHQYLVGGTGYVAGNNQPYIPSSLEKDSVLEKKNLSIQGGAGMLQGDYSVKVTATDDKKISTSTTYPHNDGGNWVIKRTIMKPTSLPSWLPVHEHFLATHSKREGCVQEYVSKRIDTSKGFIPKIVD